MFLFIFFFEGGLSTCLDQANMQKHIKTNIIMIYCNSGYKTTCNNIFICLLIILY